MAADLREMQENQWVSEIQLDKLEFDLTEEKLELTLQYPLVRNRIP